MTSPTLAPPGHKQTDHGADLTAHLSDRLARIAALLTPCPPPGLAHGYDLCAHAVPWPCPTTRATWLAQGLDPHDQDDGELLPDDYDPDDRGDSGDGSWCESCRRVRALTIWTHRGMAFALCQTCAADARTAAAQRTRDGGQR